MSEQAYLRAQGVVAAWEMRDGPSIDAEERAELVRRVAAAIDDAVAKALSKIRDEAAATEDAEGFVLFLIEELKP